MLGRALSLSVAMLFVSNFGWALGTLPSTEATNLIGQEISGAGAFNYVQGYSCYVKIERFDCSTLSQSESEAWPNCEQDGISFTLEFQKPGFAAKEPVTQVVHASSFKVEIERGGLEFETKINNGFGVTHKITVKTDFNRKVRSVDYNKSYVNSLIIMDKYKCVL